MDDMYVQECFLQVYILYCISCMFVSNRHTNANPAEKGKSTSGCVANGAKAVHETEVSNKT
jgi:hypothetical protein